MISRGNQKGLSLIELLISLTVTIIASSALVSFLIHNSQINKTQQMTVEVQSNARNCLAMIVAKLRSAGWDPTDAGIATVALDPDTSDTVSQIEVFADLDADSATTSDGEQVLIRHTNNRIEWRQRPGDPFVVLATNVSNDADEDGTIEPMFTPDSTVDPTRITVRITSRSAVPEPRENRFILYTVTSQVVLRKAL